MPAGWPEASKTEKVMRTISNVIRNRRPFKQSRRLFVLLIAIALAGINPGLSRVAARRAGARTAISDTERRGAYADWYRPGSKQWSRRPD